MKRPFQITKTSIYNNYVTLWLNDNLNYKDKSSNCITVFNKAPFNTYKAGDDVIIDTAAVAGHPQSAIFGESQISKSSF